MNYETLYNSIQAYAENTEQLFVANIPVFVQEAEDRMYITQFKFQHYVKTLLEH